MLLQFIQRCSGDTWSNKKSINQPYIAMLLRFIQRCVAINSLWKLITHFSVKRFAISLIGKTNLYSGSEFPSFFQGWFQWFGYFDRDRRFAWLKPLYFVVSVSSILLSFFCIFLTIYYKTNKIWLSNNVSIAM